MNYSRGYAKSHQPSNPARRVAVEERNVEEDYMYSQMSGAFSNVKLPSNSKLNSMESFMHETLTCLIGQVAKMTTTAKNHHELWGELINDLRIRVFHDASIQKFHA